MRVRITIEYDTDEDLEYERKAWLEGDVGVMDILGAEVGTVVIEDAAKLAVLPYTVD